MNSKFTFIDLFAGMGGLRLPFTELGGDCVFSSEVDKFARITYQANYGEVPTGDILEVNTSDIPDHDVLLAGFPCQAFSIMGNRLGFLDTRGTLFFDIQRILAEKSPKAFLLENVKNLKTHDKGNTFSTILRCLKDPKQKEQQQYWVDYSVLNACDFGVPQNRERIYLIGFNKEHFPDNPFEAVFEWPTPPKTPTRVGDIMEPDSIVLLNEKGHLVPEGSWEYMQRHKEIGEQRGRSFGFQLVTAETKKTRTIPAKYGSYTNDYIDQSHLGKRPRKFTPRELARLQGFPDTFIIDKVSHSQIYKQIGNSVCIPVVRALAEEIIGTITAYSS